jgi:hypothetical protein
MRSVMVVIVLPRRRLEASTGHAGELFPAQELIHQLRSVTKPAVSAIVDQVPEDRMSPVCRLFTLELLEENRLRLLAMEVAE